MDGKKKIFITGASGFLGRHFIRDSSKDQFSISALVRDKKSVEQDPLFRNINLFEGDLNRIEEFSNEIQKCDYFLHIAGEKKDISKMIDVNVNSFKNVISIISKTEKLKIIYLSSCGVYGIHHPNNILSEEKTCYPDSIYENTKWMAEEYLKEYSLYNPLQYLILRPSNIFGEEDYSNKLLNLMNNMQRGNFFFLNDDAVVNYVYVKYVTDSILYFLRNDKINNQIYNINSPIRLNDFIAELPKGEIPQETRGYEGFFHVTDLSGSIEKTVLELIIRDHNKKKFEKRKVLIEKITKKINKKFAKQF